MSSDPPPNSQPTEQPAPGPPRQEPIPSQPVQPPIPETPPVQDEKTPTVITAPPQTYPSHPSPQTYPPVQPPPALPSTNTSPSHVSPAPTISTTPSYPPDQNIQQPPPQYAPQPPTGPAPYPPPVSVPLQAQGPPTENVNSSAPAAVKPTDLNISRESAFEFFRYILYACSFIFGIIAWGKTADELLPRIFIPGFGNTGKCLAFGLQDINQLIFDANNGDLTVEEATDILESSDWTCAFVITIGVLLTVFLTMIIIWHSTVYFSRPGLPYKLEGILLCAMAVIWFVLAVVTLAKPDDDLRNASSEIKLVIAGCWIAMFTHGFGGVLALVQWREMMQSGGSETNVASA